MSAVAPPEAPAVPVRDAADFVEAAHATPEQVADLSAYRELLTDWNQRMNLVGASTLEQFWSRHAWDSAQLLAHAPGALTWADLGAGAGLPGVVLAIMGKGRPGFQVHLVDSLAKRCRFLSEVVAALDLPAAVHNARAEALELKVEVVTARACAPMTRLLGFAQPYIRRGAEALFLKGQDVVSELETATISWDFDAEVLPSLSDARGRIVRIRRLGRARKA